MSENAPLLQLRKFTAACGTKILADKIFAGYALSFSAYLAASAVLSVLFWLFPWTVLPVVWISVTVLQILAFVIIAAALFIRRPSLINTARFVESKSGIKHPSLSLSLELSRNDTDNASQPLKTLTYERAVSELEVMGKTRFLPSRKRVRAIAAGLLIFNAALITFSSNKLTHYWKLPFVMIAGEKARVEPGSVTVPMNASVNLRLTGAGRHFPSARIETRPLDGQNKSGRFLKADSTGGFSLRVENVKESFVYQFHLSSPTPPETVTVVPPPALRSLQITLTPPSYTKLPVRKLPLGQGNITAYAGTKVNVTLESGDLKKAGVIIGNDTVLLDVNKKTAAGSFTVTKSAEYTFALTDTLGQPSDSLARFIISRVDDEPPTARIPRPNANKVLSAAQAETLWVEGVDDFGISKLELRYRRSGEPPDGKHESSWDVSEKGSPPLIRKQLLWNIRELSLYPGDTLYYWLMARDSKPFGKPQVAHSDTFWFRVPSFEEIHKEIVQKEQYAQEKIGEVRNRQNQISSNIEKLVKSAVGSKELSWDQKRVLEDVKEQMKAQADSLQKAFEALEESMEALREDGKIDEELLAKMEQIQKSVEELMKEFGKELFAADDNQKMTMNDMKQAANKLQQMLPQLSEQLDQTLAFLEMLRQEKELADLALRAENLAAEQTELAGLRDDAANGKKQRELLDRIDGLNSDVGEFFKKQDGDTPPSSQQIQELSQQMREQDGESGNNSSDDRKNGDKKSGGKNAMARELLSLSEELKSNMRVNMMAKMEEERRLILSMAHDMLSLEEWQNLIMAQSFGSEDNRKAAFAQQALRNAVGVSFAKSDSLSMAGPQLLSEITRVYRNALSKAGAAVSSLAETDGSAHMEQSVYALRETANLLLSILDEEGDGNESNGGAGGMMSGLRRASGRQAALNSMMGGMLQQLLGRGQKPGGAQGRSGGGGQEGNEQGGTEGGGEGGEAESEARKQAREAQQAIADELKRLADDYGKQAGPNMEERVKSLEQEARRIAALLENPPEDIIDQQDRFLSRMLQATLSLNRKDEGKEERKGNVSETLFSESGADANAGSASEADSFHLLRKRAFEDNFPEEYRSAVREYFDAIGEMKWTE